MPSPLWLLAAFVGHGALWVEAVNRLHGVGLPRKIVDALTLVCGLAVTGLPLLAAWRLGTEGALPEWLEAYGGFSIVVLVAVVVSRALLRWDPLRDRESDRPTKVELLDVGEQLGEAAAGKPLVAKAARLPGNQLLRVSVEHRDVPLDRLPPSWDGWRVAHLTDLHMSGRLSRGYFEAIVERVNAWEPHLVAITGDIVEHTPQLDWIDDTLGRLTPSVGSFFILGNHDEKVDTHELRRRLTAAGLADASAGPVELPGDTAGCYVTGDERPWFDRSPTAPADARFVLKLAHSPDRFGAAYAEGVDLMLAGHCHGGQVCFPIIGPLLCPSQHGVRYAKGTFRRGRTVMHASRGTGSLFPLRYACPPELGLFTLRSNEKRTDRGL